MKFKLSSILSPQQQKRQKEQHVLNQQQQQNQQQQEPQPYNLFISKRMKGWWTVDSYKKDGQKEQTVRILA